jgi:hypothetical protein
MRSFEHDIRIFNAWEDYLHFSVKFSVPIDNDKLSDSVYIIALVVQ